MPLPLPGTIWPPKNLHHAFRKYAEHSAWFSGNIHELAATYSNTQATHNRGGVPHKGGLIGGFSRLFWGKPLLSGEHRTVLHVPMAADLARLSSRLLYAEPPEFTADHADAQDRLDLMFNAPAAHMMLNENGQFTAALGGSFLTADWNLDGEHDYVFPKKHSAATAVPEWNGEQLTAVTFWTPHRRKNHLYLHLERHEVGAIIHTLYEADESTLETRLGGQLPLTVLDDTAYLTEIPGAIHQPTMTVIETHISRLAAVYMPNTRPNPEFMNLPDLWWVGKSDYAGIEPVLSALDETWSSWMRDLRAGKARLFVPEAMLKSAGPGKGAIFEGEQEVYAQLQAIPNKDGDMAKNFQAQQFDIRVNEHERTAYNLTKVILRSGGYSLSSYGEYGQSQITATEVIDRKADSELTRDEKKRYAAAALTYMASVCLEIDGIVFPGRGGRPGITVEAAFPETSQEDPEKTAQIIQMLDAAHAISLQTKIERANPDWDETRVQQERDAILRETASGPAPDPGTFTFDDADTDPTGADQQAAA